MGESLTAATATAPREAFHEHLFHVQQPKPQQQQELLLGVCVALLALILSSFLTNYCFGHPTYFKDSGGAENEDDDEEKEKLQAVTGIQLHEVTNGEAAAAAALLQDMLPHELIVSDILAYLSPYEVTRLQMASPFLRDVGEDPKYWMEAMKRADVLQDSPSSSSPSLALPSSSLKLEFFRRMFLKPYNLVKGHDTIDSCRVIIHGKVYDVTPFLFEHPGGEYILLEHAGVVDATTVFELSYHSTKARRMMHEYLMWNPEEARCLGKSGTILGLLRAVTRGMMNASSERMTTKRGTAGDASAAGSSNVRRRVISPILSSTSSTEDHHHRGGGRIRPGEGRAPPNLVHALESLTF